jgi:XTP/dITP diphosphohydrolase
VSVRVLVATRSAGKLRELLPLLAGAGFDAIDLAAAGVAPSAEEEALEQFATFEQNALAKAHYFLARTGLPTLADDSGLCVRALGGAPGVHSKRYSGRRDLEGVALDEANSTALLAAVGPLPDRAAHYVCVAAFADWQWATTARGECHGRIVDERRGGEGFGYDPWFVSDELGVTFGEADRATKEEVSHRGRAFRGLLGALALRSGGR